MPGNSPGREFVGITAGGFNRLRCDAVWLESFEVCGVEIRVLDEELSEALKQLSERNRENLLMYYFLEMSDTEIAKAQKISRAGVFKNRYRALQNLKKTLTKERE